MLRKRIISILTRKRKFVSISSTSFSKQHDHEDFNKKYNSKKLFGATLFSSVLIATVLAEKPKSKKNTPTKVEAGEKRPDLPTYRADEVSKHDSKKSFWVTYRHGVYDVTKFLPSHPGGEQIYNAAGLSIEPFWNVYGIHKTDEIYKLLESYRIGNLHDDDIVDHSDEELWAKEPSRRKELIVKTKRPFNAEIPPKYQIEHFDTPKYKHNEGDLFYVRQHMPVPEVDPSNHKLLVTVISDSGTKQTKTFSLEDLKKFPPASVRAALMCAGNRRSEMNKHVKGKEVKGLDWKAGAISSAVWEGVYLRDVLIECGVDPCDVDGKHVILMGSDIDATGTNFNTSIPLVTAMNESNQVLLAMAMNGSDLPLDHGFPLRAVVPGAPAVRSVKWLGYITVSRSESDSHWHQKDYRSFNSSKTWETADFSTAPPVYSLPVTSAICDPQDGDTVNVKDGYVVIKGYAYSGGGARILRVDLTSDGGQSWSEATFTSQDKAPAGQHYAWTIWEGKVPVPKGSQTVEIWAKATDSNFNTQPERFDDIWNIRGILSNAYHRITVHLKNS